MPEQAVDDVKVVQTFVGLRVENRYAFDFGACSASKGWAQVDTTQDASYFGGWAHLEKRQIVTYAEGDLTIQTCATAEAFAREMSVLKAWNEDEERGYWKGVDAHHLAGDWYDAGLGEYLHEFDRKQLEAKRAGEDPPDPAPPGATVVRAQSASQLRALLAE